MNTINRKKAQLSVAAVAALAIFAVAAVMLLSGSFATGPAQAQPNPDRNVGKYTDPQPCGINVSAVPDNPDAELSEGHVALFDAYWDYNTQTLNNNLCPPLAEHTIVRDDYGDVTGIVTGRTASNIDINKTVFHAGDEFKHTVTAEEKRKYKFLPPAGTKVWWLKQDDPIAEAAEPAGEEEPELVLGISAGLFHKDDWKRVSLGDDTEGGPPLQYEFEAERDPEGNVIPFVVFENDAKEPIWDSRDADTNSIQIEPGEYKHYNWVFFPGFRQSHTYELSVHMKGHVRTNLPPGRTRHNWKPLTWPNGSIYDPSNDFVLGTIEQTVTSEVKKYTIHVGPLHINEQPRFGFFGVVNEGAAPDTQVGHHVAVYGTDRDGLEYELEGEGKEDFRVVEQISGSWTAVKIVVAEGADLRYPERPYYDLLVKVYDGHDREDGENMAIDDTIPARIQVFPDNRPYAFFRFHNEYPRIGETTYFEAAAAGFTGSAVVTGYTLREGTVTVENGARVTNWETVKQVSTSNHYARIHFTRETPGTRMYEVEVSYQPSGGGSATVKSAVYPITWRR